MILPLLLILHFVEERINYTGEQQICCLRFLADLGRI